VMKSLPRPTALGTISCPSPKGGAKGWKNIVLSCDRCNSAKGDTYPTKAELKKFAGTFGWYPKMKGGQKT